MSVPPGLWDVCFGTQQRGCHSQSLQKQGIFIPMRDELGLGLGLENNVTENTVGPFSVLWPNLEWITSPFKQGARI